MTKYRSGFRAAAIRNKPAKAITLFLCLGLPPSRYLAARGIDTAVVVSIDEWRKLKDEKRLSWKDVLLSEGPRFDIPSPSAAC
jgi:hypothetical protein